MQNLKLQKSSRQRRKRKIRKNIFGTLERPRVSVYKSNRYIYAQAIDDDKRVTITQATTLGKDKKGIKLDVKTSAKVGEEIANKLKEKKINRIVFDRNGFLYTGRIKALADGMRKAGINF
ncbi:MAG: 50S ribosomal protein L18 [Spirochaetes bacterium]|nr:50S ribosomal protein L18 [Spirochaetota bacterium]